MDSGSFYLMTGYTGLTMRCRKVRVVQLGGKQQEKSFKDKKLHLYFNYLSIFKLAIKNK